MIKAKSIMKTNVVSVKRDATIYEAAGILIKKKYTGLPVVNDDMTLAGVISEKDILRFVSDLHLLDLICDLKESGVCVEDVMTTSVVSFDEDDQITDICRVLVENNFRRVPILSQGKLVGILSRKDIIAYIMQKADSQAQIQPAAAS